jgi:hypothetical protein
MAELKLSKSKIKSWALRILPSAIFVLIFLLLNYWWKQNSPNRDDAKLKELHQLSLEIPVYPDFTEVVTHESSRAMDAGLYKYYFSTAEYDDVKQFYARELGNRGWKLSSEQRQYDWFRDYGGRNLAFEKGDFLIAIEYAGAGSNDRSNYSINFIWKNR